MNRHYDGGPCRFHGAMGALPISSGFFHDSNPRRRKMQASNVYAPITANNATIFVTVELSQKTWLVTMHSPDRERISRHKLGGGDRDGLLTLIERVRERATQTHALFAASAASRRDRW